MVKSTFWGGGGYLITSSGYAYEKRIVIEKARKRERERERCTNVIDLITGIVTRTLVHRTRCHDKKCRR